MTTRQKRKPAPVSKDRIIEIMGLFLNYSFKDIHFDYRGLTAAEKLLVTPREFRALARYLKGGRRGTR